MFATYACTKEHFMGLLRALSSVITAQNEKENRVDCTVRVRHTAISRKVPGKVFGKSARENPEKYFG